MQRIYHGWENKYYLLVLGDWNSKAVQKNKWSNQLILLHETGLRHNFTRAGLISPQWRQSSIRDRASEGKTMPCFHGGGGLNLLKSVPSYFWIFKPNFIPFLCFHSLLWNITSMSTSPPHHLSRPSTSTAWVARWPAHGHCPICGVASISRHWSRFQIFPVVFDGGNRRGDDPIHLPASDSRS